MVTGRGTLYGLLLVVAGAAAMLSFAALRDLAELCGFAPVLAWLLPVVVDAGAAAGSLVWLGERTAERARRFARRLALGLLGSSVAANALGHGLAAFALRPPWWVVVVLSGIAPAVLGAMVHLAVLVGRPAELGHNDRDVLDEAAPAERDDPPPAVAAHAFPWPWSAAAPAAAWPPHTWAPGDPAAGEQDSSGSAPSDSAGSGDDGERAAVLIAAGAGRRRLSRELGVTEYEARRLLERARPTTDTSTNDPDDDTQDATDGPGVAPSTAGAQS